MSGLVVCALAAMGAARVAAAEDGQEAAVDLEPLRLDEIPARLYALPRGVAAADAQPAVAATIAGRRVLFFDVDGNGRFGDAGTDGWRIEDDAYRFVVPVEDAIVIGSRRAWLRFDADGPRVHVRIEEAAWPAAPEGATKSLQKIFRRGREPAVVGLEIWNDLRLRNGLPPVHLGAEETRACLLHAAYMLRWGTTHDQDPEREGATEEGRRAGASGCVGSKRVPAEIRDVYATFYHRISLFHPATRGAGIGDAGGSTVLNGTLDRVDRPWQWPVAIPADGTTDVPRAFVDESPQAHEDLRRDGTIRDPGFPVSLTFERDEVTAVTADLRIDGPEGPQVPFALSWPERPAHPTQPGNYRSIVLVPHLPLRSRTRYWVHVAWTYRGTPDGRTWTFRTGR